MAEPIGVASGLLALAVFAFQSSRQLYQLVESFQNNQRAVRELREELEALSEVLQSVQETVASTDVDLATLKLPLLRCGKACKEFEAVIVTCAAHSSGSRTSFRDWAKLKYMGDGIVGFKNMLAGYKSTIMIALGNANIRKSVITASVLKEYKGVIENTTADLEDHLQEIDKKLQSLSLQGETISGGDAAERQQVQEERDSTQQCLDICAQVATYINQVHPDATKNISSPLASYQKPIITLGGLLYARQTTVDTFNACKERLSTATNQLENHLQNVNNRLKEFSSQPLKQSDEQVAELDRMKEELESVKQCLAICSEATVQVHNQRINDFEDVSMTDDGQQVIISTFGDLVSAKRVSAGARSFQWLGQMSDESLQQLSRDRSLTITESVTKQPIRTDSQFQHRYGAGVTIRSLNLNDKGTTDK
ncbi:hypothetical protein B7463_g6721, partial [Scytalidium lignicola]